MHKSQQEIITRSLLSKKLFRQFLLLIFMAILGFPLVTLSQPDLRTASDEVDKFDKIEDFTHYREDGTEFVEMRVTTMGNYDTIRDANNPNNVIKRLRSEKLARMGYRYSNKPETLYLLKHDYHDALFIQNSSRNKKAGEDSSKLKVVGVGLYDLPVVSIVSTRVVHHHDFKELTSLAGFLLYVSGTMSVKNWPLPAIASPDEVQVVAFLDEHTAAKGKNLFAYNSPIPKPGTGTSSDGAGSYSDFSDKAVPAGIVFGLMFLALGLSGAAAGAGTADTANSTRSDSDSSAANNENLEDKENTEENIEEEQPVAPDLYIRLNRKEVVIVEGASAHPSISATVMGEGEGEGDWNFSLHPIADLENAVADCSCSATSAQACQIQVTAARVSDGAGRSVSSVIQILAQNNKTGASLETTLTIVSAKHGLILVGSTPIRIAADGESESSIEITALTAFEGKIFTDFDLLKKVRFSNELETSSEASTKAYTTAAPVFRTSGDGAGWQNLRGFEKNEPATFIFKVRSQRLLPGQGESYFATAYLSDSSGQNRLAVPLMLDVDLMQNQSRAWEIELERCRQIINRLPEVHRTRLLAMVDAQSALLGAKGLYTLRKRIWQAGQALWEAEGLSGYESVERWAGYIENTLNFAQWTGRMATDALIANKLKIGVFAAMAVGEIYDLVLSGIQTYQHNKTFDDWLEECFWKDIKAMFINMGSAALDPDLFVAKFGQDKRVIAIAWSVQFGYHFIANLGVHKMSVIDAAKKAATTVATAAALKFLAKKMGEIAKKKGLARQNIDDAAELGWQDAKKKVSDFEGAFTSGDKKMLRDKMFEIQSDKFALKEINKWPKEIRQAYNDEIGKMYASIDKRVQKKIIQDLKKQGIEVSSKNLKMTNATNAKKIVKVGSDRDISVEYSYIDKKGREVTLEYPKDKLRDVYGRELYRTAGFKNAKDLTPDELMDKYDQYALDSTDAEAYGLKRNKYFRDGSGSKKISKIELENPDFAKAMNKTGLDLKFDDSSQIGMTAAYKGKHWFNKASDAVSSGNLVEGESFKMEGMSQLVKQYKNLYKPRRDLIDMMGKPQADDTVMRKLINMMEKAVNLEKSPSYVEKMVKANGYNSLHEFSDAFGGKISTMNSSL